MSTRASPNEPLWTPPDGRLEERSRRARTEPMSVLAVGDGRYAVDAASGDRYLVDLEAGRCGCPDHRFRGARCKHVRRVAIEITEGRVPPPGAVVRDCRDCETSVFVDEDAPGPTYCPDHELSPGDRARDRETGTEVIVVGVSELRADHVHIPSADCTVAEYPTNGRYGPDVPVVAAIYPHARVAPNGTVPASLRTYLFPRTRLRRIGPP